MDWFTLAVIMGVLIVATGRTNAAIDTIKGIPDELTGNTLTLDANVTTYHPTGDLTSMEGGPKDRYGRLLVTVEQSQATGKPYSVAADYTMPWYWKDRPVTIEGVPGIGRLCDTGGHFYGAGKVYRYVGFEPFDVCTDSGGEFSQAWGVRKAKVTLGS